MAPLALTTPKNSGAAGDTVVTGWIVEPSIVKVVLASIWKIVPLTINGSPLGANATPPNGASPVAYKDCVNPGASVVNGSLGPAYAALGASAARHIEPAIAALTRYRPRFAR